MFGKFILASYICIQFNFGYCAQEVDLEYRFGIARVTFQKAEKEVRDLSMCPDAKELIKHWDEWDARVGNMHADSSDSEQAQTCIDTIETMKRLSLGGPAFQPLVSQRMRCCGHVVYTASIGSVIARQFQLQGSERDKLAGTLSGYAETLLAKHYDDMRGIHHQDMCRLIPLGVCRKCSECEVPKFIRNLPVIQDKLRKLDGTLEPYCRLFDPSLYGRDLPTLVSFQKVLHGPCEAASISGLKKSTKEFLAAITIMGESIRRFVQDRKHRRVETLVDSVSPVLDEHGRELGDVTAQQRTDADRISILEETVRENQAQVRILLMRIAALEKIIGQHKIPGVQSSFL